MTTVSPYYYLNASNRGSCLHLDWSWGLKLTHSKCQVLLWKERQGWGQMLQRRKVGSESWIWTKSGHQNVWSLEDHNWKSFWFFFNYSLIWGSASCCAVSKMKADFLALWHLISLKLELHLYGSRPLWTFSNCKKIGCQMSGPLPNVIKYGDIFCSSHRVQILWLSKTDSFYGL